MRYASVLAVLIVTLSVSTAKAMSLGLVSGTLPDLNVTMLGVSYSESSDTLSIFGNTMPMYSFMGVGGNSSGLGMNATDFQLTASIDATGTLLAGPSTLTVISDMGAIGSGTLLTATITDFGFEVASDPMGGNLVTLEFIATVGTDNLPEAMGPIIGIIATFVPTTSVNDPPFNQDFRANSATFNAFTIPSPAAAGVGLMSFVLLALGRRRSLA